MHNAWRSSADIFRSRPNAAQLALLNNTSKTFAASYVLKGSRLPLLIGKRIFHTAGRWKARRYPKGLASDGFPVFIGVKV